jgi:hydroxysqualene dehydroxylase
MSARSPHAGTPRNEARRSEAPPTAVVVGGGLAGITAALRLADRGARVVLVEARPHLGGATYSFPRGDLTVDTGQHVFLRCYDTYRGLLNRLGVSDLAPIQDRFAIPVLYRPGAGLPFRVARLRRGGGPAPVHLARGLAGYAPLSYADRCRAGVAAVALRTVDPDDARTDTRSFGRWLRDHRQSTRAIEALWGLITVAALNLHPDEASLALAARVFRTGLLERADAADIGVPAVPLRRLHAEPAAGEFARIGVRLHTKTKVTAVEPTTVASPGADGRDGRDGRFVVRTTDSEVVADVVVLAVPHTAAAQIVPPRAAPDRHRWSGLGAAPIVNVHLRYDRPVTDLPFAAGLDSPVQWVFDRTKPAGVDDGGQYLAVSVSAAHDSIDVPAEQLRETQRTALAELFPAARDARLVESFVTREPHATFRQGPGTAALRPAPTTKLPGLALAGAWTATGWPDTMEGAVRSGLLAADSITSTTPTLPWRDDPRTPALTWGDTPAAGRALTEATS